MMKNKVAPFYLGHGVVSLDISRTISEILTHKARKSPFSLTVLRL